MENIRRATAILRMRAALAAGQLSAGAESEQRSVRHFFSKHLLISNSLMRREPDRREALLAEAFEVAQLTRATAAASAVAYELLGRVAQAR